MHFLAGSKFWHTGAFEVKKETNTDSTANSLIDVNISSDLLGLSEVQVRVTDRGRLIRFFCFDWLTLGKLENIVAETCFPIIRDLKIVVYGKRLTSDTLLAIKIKSLTVKYITYRIYSKYRKPRNRDTLFNYRNLAVDIK